MTDSFLAIREQILQKRKEFDFLSPYLGIFGMKDRCAYTTTENPAFPEFKALLESYWQTGKALLKEQATRRDPKEALALIHFGIDAYGDPSYDEDEGKLLDDFVSYYGAGEIFSLENEMLLLYVLINGFRRSHYPWRGKDYALQLCNVMAEIEAPRQIDEALLDFYQSVLDHPSVVRVALTGAERYYKSGDLDTAAGLALRGYAAAMNVPDYPIPTDEEIVEKYQEKAKVVLRYRKYSALKRDPIESSPAFQEAYDEVMEEVMPKYLASKAKVGALLWTYMKEGFARRGIEWKDPRQMNPSIRFD